MPRQISTVVGLSVLAMAAFCACTQAAAQDYPTQTIKVIVGAGPDFVGRIVAQHLTQIFGQQAVVEQLPGAGGIVAAQTVARARPNGYTLLATTASYAAQQAYRPDVSYNLSTDFEHIGLIGVGPALLLVNPSLGVTSLKDLVAAAKAKPGELDCASSGPGTQAHLGCEMLRVYGKADIIHVPYNGMSAALIDTISGRAQILFGFSSFLPYVRSGKLTAVAVTSGTRLALAPDIPTTAEAGLPSLQYVTWYGLDAPKGTPKPIIDRLSAALRTMLADPQVKQQLLAAGFEAQPDSPAEFSKFVDEDLVRWKKIVADTGVKAE